MLYVLNTMIMNKQKFEWRKWDSLDVEVAYDLPKKLEMYFYGYVGIKKNSKEIVRGRLIASPRYQEWHKRIISKLKWRERKYNSFPCKMTITTIAWDRRKGDCDNFSQWIMDIGTELWLFPDDNKFVISELEVKNAWYIKNCYITKVELEPIEYSLLNNEEDHNGKDLKTKKELLKQLNVF